MELEDKLKQLRRERKKKNRSQSIQDTWKKLDKDDDLSVKEKLEKLITLTDKPHSRSQKARAAEFEPLPRKAVQVLENSYRLGVRYGHIPISLGLDIPGPTLAFLSRDDTFNELDLSSSVFIDLETTGLSGGTGTVPFLVGLGFYHNDRFQVVQYFLGEMSEEEKMVKELGRFFEEMDFQSVVTYNGKAFDMPMLETRFALHRTPFPAGDLPHFDFLFSARNLWKHKYDSCRLFDLAQEIVQAERAEDIPSAEIPLRYFQYLRTGNFSLVEPILYHNEEDLLSLLGIIIAGAVLVDKNKDAVARGEADAMDLYGVARIFERAGDVTRSATLLEKALEGSLTSDVSFSAKKKLSLHFKRNQSWDKALPLWQGMTEGEDEVFCLRELAMYYEHREKNFEEAIKAAEEGLAASMEQASKLRKDFEKRIVRLKGKIKKREGRKKS